MMAQCRITGCLCLIQTDQPADWLVYTQGNCGRSSRWQTSHSSSQWNFKTLWQVCKKGIKLPVIPCHRRIASIPGYQEEEPVISRLHTLTTPNLSFLILCYVQFKLVFCQEFSRKMSPCTGSHSPPGPILHGSGNPAAPHGTLMKHSKKAPGTDSH